jgi:hypothetical protein
MTEKVEYQLWIKNAPSWHMVGYYDSLEKADINNHRVWKEWACEYKIIKVVVIVEEGK